MNPNLKSDPEAIVDAVENVRKSFAQFLAGKKQANLGVHGQTIGHESYRLYFTGNQEGIVWDAIAQLIRATEPKP